MKEEIELVISKNEQALKKLNRLQVSQPIRFKDIHDSDNE